MIWCIKAKKLVCKISQIGLIIVEKNISFLQKTINLT